MFKGLFKTRNTSSDYTIVLVDDDEAIRDLITTLLEDEGYKLLTASNAQEALHILDQDHSPDLLITDLGMPKMDGQELLARARVRFGRTGMPPVLILSANQGGEGIANNLEVTDYLAKPFDIEDLLQHIRSLLHQNRKNK